MTLPFPFKISPSANHEMFISSYPPKTSSRLNEPFPLPLYLTPNEETRVQMSYGTFPFPIQQPTLQLPFLSFDFDEANVTSSHNVKVGINRVFPAESDISIVSTAPSLKFFHDTF